ncbi:Metallo-dependent phosphatase-like protein, partial [Fimicolochytrium jonesii]|uniref:Metallo-dependent phosphatase-like protein n=1 Tax=Fimicolochytrium jonesii TaxID=1396493 RepID=UPI0022FF4122
MRRNFRLISSKLEPHGYWVLGDIMDGGREWGSSRYESEAQRVKSVFNVRDGTPIFWAAGNHDIGFGDKVIPEAYDRYRAVFGEPNYAVEVANHTLIVLDTVSLSGPAGTRPADAALDFLTDFSEGESSSNPRILGTHVPLYRRDDHDCGKLRRNPPMKQGRGYQYQNLVVESLSKHILEKIKPSLVLSGDDHDWCENEHTFESGTAKEYTVATFSWMQGNVHPGYALLTLLPSHAAPHPTTPTQTFALATCPLPPQIPVYIWYAFLALITLPLLLHWTYRQVWADAPSYIQIPMFSYGNQRGEFLRRSARRRSARLSVANSRGRGGGGVVARVCARAPGLWM